MLKKLNILTFNLLLITSIEAQEPFLAKLENTFSNEIQRFGVGKYTFECRPYGVLSIDRLYSSSKDGSTCQQNIDKFYAKNPKSKYYVDALLENKQMYHLEIKDNECIIYAKGQITLSELLLKDGLAIKKPMFRDEEFESYFTIAQRKAKIKRIGLWDENIFNSCIAELYK